MALEKLVILRDKGEIDMPCSSISVGFTKWKSYAKAKVTTKTKTNKQAKMPHKVRFEFFGWSMEYLANPWK